MDGIKVDFYDPREKIIHEIKKSNKIEEAHEWQVKYYIHVMERNGITGVTGIIEYPKLRKTKEVILSDKDRKEIFYFLEEIPKITGNETSPSKINSRICKNCSYHDFCYCGEV
jgi:CRISPR-associated exonuclease Cas4